MYKSCVTLFFPANKADLSPAGEHDLLKNLPGSILAEKLSELIHRRAAVSSGIALLWNVDTLAVINSRRNSNLNLALALL